MPTSSSTTSTLGPEAAGPGARGGAVMPPRLGQQASRPGADASYSAGTPAGGLGTVTAWCTPKPQLSRRDASEKIAPVLVGALSRTTPISVRWPWVASNSRHSPAAMVQPVLIPIAPG